MKHIGINEFARMLGQADSRDEGLWGFLKACSAIDPDQTSKTLAEMEGAMGWIWFIHWW